MINAIQAAGIASAPEIQRVASPAIGGAGGGFAQLIDRVMEATSTQQANATVAVRELAMGQTDNVHSVLLEVAKADMTFRMILEIRNRLMDAYQEMMRMQM